MSKLDLPLAGAFRHAGFRRYWTARVLGNVSAQITGLSVAWQVYNITGDPFHLGLVGLALFLPSFLLVLVTGAAADRFNRATIMTGCIVGECLCVLALFIVALRGGGNVVPIFCSLAVLGTVRAFCGPAQQSLLPDLVPRDDLASAIAWAASTWQIAAVAGPIVGGFLYAMSPETAYATAFALMSLAAATAARLSAPRHVVEGRPGFATFIAGFRYVWTEKVVLGAMSLDLVAMLLGGALALLPVYARDILAVGPWGLGLLRAAPAVGSMLVAALLLRRPIDDHAGATMFVCVAMVGFTVIVFGASTDIWLSMLALGLMGAFDMVSVYVRDTLIQLRTPDAMRGRVNAVNMMVLGASSELGDFRAGLSAWAFGAVPAVLVGGAAAVGVSALWWYSFPQLRNIRNFKTVAQVHPWL